MTSGLGLLDLCPSLFKQDSEDVVLFLLAVKQLTPATSRHGFST